MEKTKIKTLLVILVTIVALVFISRSCRFEYHFDKYRYFIQNEKDVIIFDTIIMQTGKVRAYKDHDGVWKDFGLKFSNGDRVFFFMDPPKSTDRGYEFDAWNEEGVFWVTIDEEVGYVFIGQRESYNGNYQFFQVYLTESKSDILEKLLH